MTQEKAQNLNSYIAYEYLRLGVQYYQLGNNTSALTYFEKSVTLNPKNHEAWLNRGVALTDLKQLEAAIASYDQALAIKPDFHKAWYSRGVALAELGQLEESIASYDRALALEPEYPDALNNRGNALAKIGKIKEAIASYDQALAIKPDYPDVWFNRGSALHKLGEIEAALVSYDQALAINPDYPDAWNNRGSVLDDLGNREGAIASYDQALAFKPDFHKAWNNRGFALDKLGRFEEAIASYEKALAIKPDFAEALYNQGLALYKLGRFEEAIASYEKALVIQPELYQTWSDRGVVLDKLGEIEAALTSYDKALAIKPDYPDAWNNRGGSLHKLGEIEAALASYDKALTLKPDYPEAWFNRGLTLDQLGKIEAALASYNKALALKTDYPKAWLNRGRALYNLGEIEAAIASCDKGLAIQPDLYEGWITRGFAVGLSSQYNPQAAAILQTQFPQSPAVILNPIFNQRGYEAELLCYQEGLKYCTETTSPQGWGRLQQYIGKSHYFQGRNYFSEYYWKKADTSYNQALKTLTPEAFPELHLQVLQDLITVLLGLKQTPEAEELKRRGTDLLRRLLSQSKSPLNKEQLALKFAGFQKLTVDMAIQSGQIIPALETAEAGKNACLSWLLYDYRDEIESPKYGEIQQLLHPTTAIVYWHLSPAALTTFIIKHGETPKTLETFETQFIQETGFLEQRLKKFEDWVKDWNQQYADYGKGKKSEKETTSNWRDNLPEKLQQLSEILDIPKIETTLTGITDLILIPHRDLHRFPLHTLFANKYTITYLPSAKIGLIAQGKNPENQGKLLSVEHPNSEGFDDLPYAEIQSATISQHFQNPQRLSDNAATAEAIKTALALPYTIFHFTGHGTYNFFNPKKSYLALSGNDKLTIEEIVQIPLHPCQLVCLVACETAITDNQSITTEYVGLVSAFLSRGVTYVVSTLWTVESEASALIMMKFYQLLRQGEAEPVALKNAQKWLRQATWGDIQSFYAQTLASLPADADNNLRLLLEDALFRANTMEADHQPFTHPYHWAAFTITGHA